MKRFLLTMFAICFLSAYGQNANDGVYYDNLGYRIEIKNKTLKLIRSDSPGFSEMILAECSIKQFDEDFIELNSLSPYSVVNENIRIKQLWDSIINKDSIKISFSFSYTNSLDISIFTDDFKNYSFEYSKNKEDIMIPIGTKTISFSIAPRDFMPNTPEGLHYGILFFSSIDYEIEKNINHVMFAISAIDDSFFEKYYVKGEYAKIGKNSITWKGRVFLKKE